MQRTQCGIAGRNAVGNHAEAVNIHHFVKAQMLVAHFLMDAVEVFFPPFDLRFDIGADEALAESGQHFAHHVAPVAAEIVHGFLQRAVAGGMDILKSQIL